MMTHHTRRNIVSAALLSVAAISLAGCDLLPLFKAERTVTTTHIADSPIDVLTHNGGITVVREDRTDVQIILHIKATSQERADATGVTTERQADGTLLVRADWPEGKRLNREQATFEIKTPGANGATLETHNGSLTIERLAGKAILITHNGSVNAHEHNGNVLVETHNGSTDATNISGDLAVETHNGRIEATDVQGSVLLTSHNGTIRAREIGGAAEARNHNGTVNIALRSDNAAPVVARTHNGTVDITLGHAYAGQLQASTDNGSINRRNLDNATILDSGKRHLHLSFGDSNTTSTIETDNGSITIRQD